MINKLNFDSTRFLETIQTSFDCSDLKNPLDERYKDTLRLDFDRKCKVEFHGIQVTSDTGLLAYIELDKVLKLRHEKMII